MNSQYRDVYDEPLDTRFKYPIDKCKTLDKELTANAQKLRFKFQREYEMVRKDLDNLGRTPVQIKPGINCALEAIVNQVYTPPGYTANMLRKQGVCFMAEFVHEFYPLMKNYLKKRKIGFITYLEKVFSGEIWCDEYLLAGIAKMWHIRITIVSPMFSPPWEIFHDGETPHVVLVANGGDFGEHRGVTHFSASKGKSPEWRCVQPLQRTGEIAIYRGRMTGSITAVKAYEAIGRRICTEKASNITDALDDICESVQLLMQKKDKIVETMSSLNFEVDHVKYRQKYVVVSAPDYVRPKTAAVRRMQEESDIREKSQTQPKKDNTDDIVITGEEMGSLVKEFVTPAVHRKVRTKAEKKIHPEATFHTSKKRKKDKHHDQPKLLTEKQHENQEEERLPTLGKYESVSKSTVLRMEPGIIKIRDISLPREASSLEESDNVEAVSQEASLVQESDNVKSVPQQASGVEEKDNIEELSEYTGTFEVGMSDIESADRYLLEQKVITTQPGSLYTNFPEYHEVDPNAPDDTPVLFNKLPFDKASVDLYQRLSRKKDDAAKDKASQSKETIFSKAEVHQEHDYSQLTHTAQVQHEHDYSQVIGDDELHDIPGDDLDVYLPSSEHHSPKKRRLETDIPAVHKSEAQDIPSKVVIQVQRKGATSSIQKVPLQKKFACKYCGKTFTNSTYTNYHEERKCDKNMNRKLIVCECGKQYKNMTNYKDHRSKYHGEPSRHICNTCGASFPHQNGLVRHRKSYKH